MAEAGVSVISLPQTNLYLQGRDAEAAKPRGLTALAALHGAGVKVAAGGDNIQDPFNPMGRADPLEAASLFLSAGQLDVATAFDAVAASARSVCGWPGRPGGGLPRGPCRLPRLELREAMAEACTPGWSCAGEGSSATSSPAAPWLGAGLFDDLLPLPNAPA